MTDIDIARGANKKNIMDIAKSLDIPEEKLILYGNDKAKIRPFSGKMGNLFWLRLLLLLLMVRGKLPLVLV